jgi:hypothetical protein
MLKYMRKKQQEAPSDPTGFAQSPEGSLGGRDQGPQFPPPKPPTPFPLPCSGENT